MMSEQVKMGGVLVIDHDGIRINNKYFSDVLIDTRWMQSESKRF
jgi:hypothetical protein